MRNVGTCAAMPRETLKVAAPLKAEYRGTGTDGFVVAARPSNSGGAKGPDLPAKEIGQPATGGADV